MIVVLCLTIVLLNPGALKGFQVTSLVVLGSTPVEDASTVVDLADQVLVSAFFATFTKSESLMFS